MEKVKLCGGDIVSGNIEDCPMAKKLVPLENVPTFLGGKCSCPGGCSLIYLFILYWFIFLKGCVAKIPNSQTHKKGLDEEGNVIEVSGEKSPRNAEGNNDNNNNTPPQKSPSTKDMDKEKSSKKKK